MKAFASWSGPALSLLLLAGCAGDGASAPNAWDAAEPARASDQFSEWQAAQPLTEINTAANELAPEMSKDGLSLYFGSNRPGGLGGNDLYVAHRESTTDPWGAPVNLTSLNSAFGDAGPHLSRDGHYLFFTSARLTAANGNDIYVTWRADVHDDFAWGEPVNIGAPVNTLESELGPSTWAREFYFWRGPPTATSVPGDIYISEMTGYSFGEPVAVTALNSAGHDEKPAIRFDGREILLASDRSGGSGALDIWVSTRQGNGQEWEAPVNVGSTVNSAANDRRPALSADGLSLLFDSNRPGGAGGTDLYISTRERITPY